MSVSVAQLTALIDWLEAHEEVALGRLTRTTEGRALTKRLWGECAELLNSITVDCCTKSPEQWRLYYNEYKCKVLKKIKIEKAEIGATGGGPAKKATLTPLQERLYTILGRDVGEPLKGVRYNPLTVTTQNQAEEMEHAELVEAAPIAWSEFPELEFRSQERGPSISWHQTQAPAVSSPPVGNEEEAVMSSPQQITSQTSSQQRRQTPSAVPRRRRRRRRSSQIYTEHEEPALREASERLGEMERISADATREQAQATNRLAAALESIAARMEGTNRLAAAIETMAERLNDPIIVIVTQNSNETTTNT